VVYYASTPLIVALASNPRPKPQKVTQMKLEVIDCDRKWERFNGLNVLNHLNGTRVQIKSRRLGLASMGGSLFSRT
jgi:hypothetical protein